MVVRKFYLFSFVRLVGHGAYIYFFNRKVFLFNFALFFFYIQAVKFCIIVFVDLFCNYFVELCFNIESSCDS